MLVLTRPGVDNRNGAVRVGEYPRHALGQAGFLGAHYDDVEVRAERPDGILFCLAFVSPYLYS